MKALYLLPLLLIAACSTNRTPKLVIQPHEPPPSLDDTAVRYPEVVRAYHLGRYSDPNNDLLLHGEHVVWRVEAGSHWDFHPGTCDVNAKALPLVPNDAAFAPLPVNDAVLAEVNAQKAATAQIMAQARTLAAALTQIQITLQHTRTNLQQTAALRATISGMKQQLDALEAAQGRSPSFSTTNEPADSLSP